MSFCLNRNNLSNNRYPEKIIQFGEGNFLRAFVDWMVDRLNEQTDFNSGITIIRPLDSHHPTLDTQQGLYTAITRGINENKQPVSDSRIIQSVNRELLIYSQYNEVLKCAENPQLEWIFSNTTEAGIVFQTEDYFTDKPANSFPAKITQFMYHRFQFFNGDKQKGLIIVPCELIDYNGEKLKEYVIKHANNWQLGSDFIQWLNESNTFCSTLVDRIVTGYPHDEIEQLEQQLGYQDRFLVTAEYFYLFVIQGPSWLNEKLKLNSFTSNIKIVDDIKPYKERKVAILNGAHTAMVPVGYLSGFKTVGEVISDPLLSLYIDQLIKNEIIPVLSQDSEELQAFASDVISRFQNPYIKHELLSISLNSLTKFKTRLLPQLISYHQKYNKNPYFIMVSLAALILFYRGKFHNMEIPLKDDKYLLDRFIEWDELYDNSPEELVRNILSMTDLWEIDLSKINNLVQDVTTIMTSINNIGIAETLRLNIETSR